MDLEVISSWSKLEIADDPIHFIRTSSLKRIRYVFLRKSFQINICKELFIDDSILAAQTVQLDEDVTLRDRHAVGSEIKFSEKKRSFWWYRLYRRVRNTKSQWLIVRSSVMRFVEEFIFFLETNHTLSYLVHILKISYFIIISLMYFIFDTSILSSFQENYDKRRYWSTTSAWQISIRLSSTAKRMIG